jgi:hypothetical protein
MLSRFLPWSLAAGALHRRCRRVGACFRCITRGKNVRVVIAVGHHRARRASRACKVSDQ